MKRTACFLLLSILSNLSFPRITHAQEALQDSLRRVLRTAPEDTNKVLLYRKLGQSILYQDASAALDLFKKGIVLSRKLNYNFGLERCYLPASLAYSILGNYDTSLIYSDSARYVVLKGGNKDRIANVYQNRGDIFVNLLNYPAALKALDTALYYAEGTGNKDRIARIYSITSDVYTGIGQHEKALDYIDRSLPFFLELHDAHMIGMSYFSKALIYQEMGKFKDAASFCKAAIHIADSIQDKENLSAYYCSYAQVLVELKRPEEAEAAGQRSWEYAIQSGNRTQLGVVADLFRGVAYQQGNYTRAIEYGLKAYEIFKKEDDLERQRVLALALSEAYDKAGNHTDAYKYLRISHDLKDTLNTHRYTQETAKQLASFDVKQKDKEILLLNKDKELQQQKLKQQNLLLGVSLLVVVLVLLGIGLLVNRNRLRQRMKELELRNNIAADLHDEVGSSLSSIHILSQVAAQQSMADSAHTDILARVSTNARETMDKMSDIVWMIKPGQSDGVSLAQRMQRYIYEMCSSQNIACTLTGEEHLQAVKFTMQQRKNFYLVFKEALNNAVKYSGADNIEVKIELHHKECRLSIRDHGKGFHYDQSTALNGNGLGNMHNRAKELGGQLSIDTQPGSGTHVSLTVPA